MSQPVFFTEGPDSKYLAGVGSPMNHYVAINRNGQVSDPQMMP